MPEENDTVGFLDEEGEPLELISYVFSLNKSFIIPNGQLVFEIETIDSEIMTVIKHNSDDYPYTEWIELPRNDEQI